MRTIQNGFVSAILFTEKQGKKAELLCGQDM